MKCVYIFATKETLRMDDAIALVFVSGGVAKYTNKQNWKSDGRKFLDKQNAKDMLKDLKKKENQYAKV